MEEWKQICEYPLYDISNYGKVRNRKTGRILKTYISEKGYEIVSLRKDNQSYTEAIHRLVADAYISLNENNMGIIHKDNDILNSYADNLEWNTRSEISKRSFDKGRKQAHLMRTIRCVETGEIFESIEECSRKTGIGRRSISRCINNPVLKTKEGFHFESLD